ncbi:MAG: hypothetical protein V1748_02260 [Actinomycetota bacterium]
MHTTNPDLVALKTAARQQASRVEAEAKAASQWAALSRNRGFDEVASGFDALAAALTDAACHAEAAASASFEAQHTEDD